MHNKANKIIFIFLDGFGICGAVLKTLGTARQNPSVERR
jgi:hypothetical protein